MARSLVDFAVLLFVLSFFEPCLGRAAHPVASDALQVLDLSGRKNTGASGQAVEKRQVPGQVCLYDDYLSALNAVSEDAVPFCSSFISVPMATATLTTGTTM